MFVYRMGLRNEEPHRRHYKPCETGCFGKHDNLALHSASPVLNSLDSIMDIQRRIDIFRSTVFAKHYLAKFVFRSKGCIAGILSLWMFETFCNILSLLVEKYAHNSTKVILIWFSLTLSKILKKVAYYAL